MLGLTAAGRRSKVSEEKVRKMKEMALYISCLSWFINIQSVKTLKLFYANTRSQTLYLIPPSSSFFFNFYFSVLVMGKTIGNKSNSITLSYIIYIKLIKTMAHLLK